MKSVCVCVILAAVFTSSAAETDEHISLLQKSAVVDMRSAKQQSSEDETMEEYALEDAGDENENDALDESEGGKKCKKMVLLRQGCTKEMEKQMQLAQVRGV